MCEKSFDAFKFCWNIILQESAKCQNKFFNAGYCKILDSRDTNFEVVENRLAFTYKYGYFNILFFEKCFLTFINQCSEAYFPFENLKVCSLSNGPGFDIIGLLNALCISDKHLRGLPVFNAINIHESWYGLFKALICTAYKTCTVSTFAEYFHLNQTNTINIIKGDVYSTLSSEAKDCISNSNVLLMVNVFSSSKASPTVFESSLTEIFSHLNVGSLIFFIGSKNNIKHFSKLSGMKQYVKCIFGPQKVTLNDLPVDEQISNIIGVKPCDSGHANFVVWKKKNKICKSAEYEQKSPEEDITVECKDDDSDTMSEFCLSESSIASSVQNYNKSEYDLKASDKFDSNPDEIKFEIPGKRLDNISHNVNPVANITSIFSNISLNHVNSEEQNLEVCQDILRPYSNNASNSITRSNHSFPENSISTVSCCTVKKNEVNMTNDIAGSVIDRNVNKVSSVDLIMKDKAIVGQNMPKKRSRKKKGPSLNITEDQFLNQNGENDKWTQNNSENSITIEKKAITFHDCRNFNKTDNGVQSLIQRCDTLISKLEELTVDIKSEFNSRKDHIFNKTHYCNQQMKNCHCFHHNCCVNIVHSCCCRKFVNHKNCT